MDAQIIGKNIKRIRSEQGYTQASLAKLMGVQEQFVSALERGVRKPGNKTMKSLCATLGVSEEDILRDHFSDAHRLMWSLIGRLTEDQVLGLMGEVHKRLTSNDTILISNSSTTPKD